MAIDKGCTSGDLVGAGRKVLQAGIELCFYLMPGLGGREAAAAHVAGSARVLREVAWRPRPRRPARRPPSHRGRRARHSAGGAAGRGRVHAARRRAGSAGAADLSGSSATPARAPLGSRP